MTIPKSNLAAAALRYAAVGWPVLPLHTPGHDRRCSCGRGDCPKPGKHPRTRHGLCDASTNAARIRAWWAAWPEANVGVATGRLVVVDVDDARGRAALATLEHAHRRLPPTLTAASGRGAHLYFHAGAQRIANSVGRLGGGLDVRGRGGYVVAPPSLHAGGHCYRWTTRRLPAPLPSWLAELLTPAAPPPRRTPLPRPGGSAIAGGATSSPRCAASSPRSPPRDPARATTRSTARPSASASSPPPATAAATSSPGRCWPPR